jgi:hypothetical protein
VYALTQLLQLLIAEVLPQHGPACVAGTTH